MADKIKGKKAVLLAEACKLDKQSKANKIRIDEIKELLKLEAGSYVNDAGDALTISKTIKYSDVDPEQAYKAMKALKQGKRFFETVKVQIGPLGKILTKDSINGLRSAIGETVRYCFK